jgi:hypothetical protein
MPLVKPQAPPGFLSQATQVQARGGWYDGNLVRWRTGLLEKSAGWRRLIEEALPAIIRRMHAWLDLDSRKNLLAATDAGVNLVVQDTLYGLGSQIDLQGGFSPELGPLGNVTKFSVANNSKEVTVKTAAVASLGGTFLLRLPISIGGRIILGGTFFRVKSILPGVGFTFDMPMPSLVAETDTYGIPLLTNDAVNVMTVTWKAHGFTVGARLASLQETTIRLGAAGVWEKLNFSAAAGTVVTVASVVDADHFTFAMGTLGTGNGGGGANHQIYLGSRSEHVTGMPVVFTPGTVIGLAVQKPLGNPQKQSWFLGNLGQDGLVLGSGGPLQVYKPPIQNGPFLSPVGGATETTPATAPQKSNGMLTTMPQGQVILWGSEAVIGEGVIDPLMIRWSNAGSYQEYTATVSNQAGSFRLSRGSRIMGAIQAPQATLILTDTDLWQMSYIGPPLIYGFSIMGAGCGLVAPHAIGCLGRSTYWQGQKNFWQFGDTAVQPMMCTVWDYIFEDIDPVNRNKCHAAPNSTTNEMAFYFPSKHTPVDLDTNLLVFSQQFDDLTRWVLTNALAQRFSQFKTVYVYEPHYENSGWFDDAGLSPISWFDDDLQSELENLVFAPDGSDTTFLLSETAVNGLHSVSQSIDKAGERITYTLSIYAHDSSTRNLTLRAVASLGEVFATFDVVSGNVLAAGTSTPRFALVSARVLTDVLGTGRPGSGPGNGWRRYVMSFTSDDSPTLELFFNITNGTELSYMGEPPKGVLIWGAQLVLGGEPLEYEKTDGIQRQNETRFYVKVNTVEGMAWDSGRLSRSAWLDESVWGTPLGADITSLPRPTTEMVSALAKQFKPDPRNLIQQHEIGFDDDLDPMHGVFAKTGFTELGDGTAVMLIDQCHPDMKWFGRDGGVKVSLEAVNYPQGPKHLYGPYSMTPGTQWFNPRVRTRYVAVRYDWEARRGFSARVGLTTFHVKPAGKLP